MIPIRGRAELAAVPEAEQVRRYLAERRWHRVESSELPTRLAESEDVEIWRDENGAEVLVPLRREFADHGRRMNELFDTLELVEQRDFDELLVQILGPQTEQHLEELLPLADQHLRIASLESDDEGVMDPVSLIGDLLVLRTGESHLVTRVSRSFLDRWQTYPAALKKPAQVLRLLADLLQVSEPPLPARQRVVGTIVDPPSDEDAGDEELDSSDP